MNKLLQHLKVLLIVIFPLFFPILSIAQTENCSNGIDDDGDGLIDCYDSDCISDAACANFFISNSADTAPCSVHEPIFELKTLWTSPLIIDTRITTVTGDINGDGYPEVIVNNSAEMSNDPRQIYILDGRTGTPEDTIEGNPVICGYTDGAAIADVDHDGKAEIFKNSYPWN